MKKVRKQFPVLQQYIYANTPVLGPLYDDLLEWRQNRDLDFIIKGSTIRSSSLALISDTRTAVAQYFNCKRACVALVTNFSIGLNMLLEGLDKKQKVLLLENDYPSVDWPFDTRGFSISYAKINEHLEENIAEVIEKESIDILALSIVQWQSGIKIDLDFLKRLKQEHPALLIIADGTQFCGTTDFDFENSGIDVLGASAYKWMLKTIGFNAADAMPERKNMVRFAKRFEPGHLSCSNFGSLKFSIDFFDKLGKSAIDAQNKKLAQKAKKEFTALGLLPDMVVNRKDHSTIFNIKADTSVHKMLTENNVLCALRGTGIRFGFHFYNTEDEIDIIIALLKKSA